MTASTKGIQVGFESPSVGVRDNSYAWQENDCPKYQANMKVPE